MATDVETEVVPCSVTDDDTGEGSFVQNSIPFISYGPLSCRVMSQLMEMQSKSCVGRNEERTDDDYYDSINDPDYQPPSESGSEESEQFGPVVGASSGSAMNTVVKSHNNGDGLNDVYDGTSVGKVISLSKQTKSCDGRNEERSDTDYDDSVYDPDYQPPSESESEESEQFGPVVGASSGSAMNTVVKSHNNGGGLNDVYDGTSVGKVISLSKQTKSCDGRNEERTDTDHDDSVYDPDYQPPSESEREETEQFGPVVGASSGSAMNSVVKSYSNGDSLDDVHDGTSVEKCLSLFRKRKVTSGCKKVYDKTNFCCFCGTRIKSKISRHILNVHADKMAVQEILLLPKRSKDRRMQLQQLVNDGNFKHNIESIRKGHGEIVVARRSTLISKTALDYTACEFCKKWQSKKNLWRHTKTCVARKVYYETHPQMNSADHSTPKRILAVKRGQSFVLNATCVNDENALSELMKRMRDDEVKQVIMGDELICREASLRMCALGRKRDQKNDDVYRVSQSARTLGHLTVLLNQAILT